MLVLHMGAQNASSVGYVVMKYLRNIYFLASCKTLKLQGGGVTNFQVVQRFLLQKSKATFFSFFFLIPNSKISEFSQLPVDQRHPFHQFKVKN